MEINREYLRVIPYLDIEAMGARTLNLMPFWDGAKWHLWVPGPDGLIEMKVVEIVQMDYVAKEAASESDVIIPFVELMWQHASWPPIYRVISAISEDFHNLSTSIEKMTHFFERRNDIEDVAPFVKTEVEYMIILSRGVFDLLQEAIAWIWGNAVRLLDAKAEARHKQVKLPRKFSRMVLSNGNIRGPNDLINAYESISVRLVAAPKSAASIAPRL